MTGTVIASFALGPVPVAVAMLCLGCKSAGGFETAATWLRTFAAREDNQSARYRRINHPGGSRKACREHLETRHRNCEGPLVHWEGNRRMAIISRAAR
jgi:hypothetical protein